MSMNELRYNCRKCGICCAEIVEGPGVKRIPIYPEEVDKLIKIAKKQDLKFAVVEDVVFPDILNKKILILTYKIILAPLGHCPFYSVNKGCIIHDEKPLACQAYPLALKQVDAFNFQISIDPLCSWTLSKYGLLNNIDLIKLKEIFEDEYPKAEVFYLKNKKLMLKIRKMEVKNKIKITRQISLDEFNKALEVWEREEFKI